MSSMLYICICYYANVQYCNYGKVSKKSMNATDKKISNTVKEHRLAAGVTQEQLAEAIGVSRQTIISIEKGTYVPSVLLALKYAAFFSVPVEVLFTLIEG